MIPDNILNFLNSKDCLYDDFRKSTKFLVLLLILITPVFDIIFYFTDVQFFGKTSTLFDLIIAVITASACIINFITGCIANKLQYHYVYYGVNYLLISCYLFFISTRIMLYPLYITSEIAGLIFWLLISIICIQAIFYNIKSDFYCADSQNILWLKDKKTNGKYGVVLTRYFWLSVILTFVVIIGFIFLKLMYLPKITDIEKSPVTQIKEIVLLCCCYILGFIAHFSWKLLIKQYYLHKYGIKVELEDK